MSGRDHHNNNVSQAGKLPDRNIEPHYIGDIESESLATLTPLDKESDPNRLGGHIVRARSKGMWFVLVVISVFAGLLLLSHHWH
jgi:hypothetical protein